MNRRHFLAHMGLGTASLAFSRLAHGQARTAPRVEVMAGAPSVALPGEQLSFPALAADAAGVMWVAAVQRAEGGRRLVIQRVDKGRPAGSPVPVDIKGATGVGAPAVAGLAQGCLVAFPVELEARWRVACVRVGPAVAGTPVFVETEGTANLSPAVAAAGGAGWVLWESNAGGSRAIWAAPWDGDRPGKPVRLSSAGVNSYNPALVAKADGTFFAAWDSFREERANLYGAECRGGAWGAERRLTQDARIERHPALAVWKNEVWMAWQAQSYQEIRINAVTEQKIVVARVEADGLKAPPGWVAALAPPAVMQVRPRIAFDAGGRLWVSARRPIGLHGGWDALVWSHDGTAWSAPRRLPGPYGRWPGVPLAATADGVFAGVQQDNLVAGWKEQGLHPGWKSNVAVVRVAEAATESGRRIPVAPLRMPPTAFSLAERRTRIQATLPRQTVEQSGRRLTLYWGDLHDHTDLSVCDRQRNPPGHDLFANERDIEQLDFVVLTDHGYNFDAPQWAFNGEQTRQNHDPGRFVTFLGQEWTSSKNPPKDPSKPVGPGNANRYGHHNLVFLDPHHPRFYDSYDGDISPGELWRQLKGHEFLCIPHQLADWKKEGGGNPPTDWSFHDERCQPVAEIFQHRRSYEHFGCPRQAPEGAPFAGHYYLQDAWAKGLVIGVIASPDHGGGMGKAGVWAEELTREAIFKAIRARHTFGTSGAKMALLLRAGDAMMGDDVLRPAGPIPFTLKAVAASDIQELVIFRNNQVVHRIKPGRKDLELEWTDTPPADAGRLWYYARIHAADDELAWTSPIWFRPA